MSHHPPPSSIAAVMVCEHAACADAGPGVVQALTPLVSRTPHALLLRTGCVQGPACAGHGDPGSASHATHGREEREEHEERTGCWVRLQRCTQHLQPVGASMLTRGSSREAYRQVEEWLDATQP